MVCCQCVFLFCFFCLKNKTQHIWFCFVLGFLIFVHGSFFICFYCCVCFVSVCSWEKSRSSFHVFFLSCCLFIFICSCFFVRENLFVFHFVHCSCFWKKKYVVHVFFHDNVFMCFPMLFSKRHELFSMETFFMICFTICCLMFNDLFHVFISMLSLFHLFYVCFMFKCFHCLNKKHVFFFPMFPHVLIFQKIFCSCFFMSSYLFLRHSLSEPIRIQASTRMPMVKKLFKATQTARRNGTNYTRAHGMRQNIVKKLE